MVDARLLDVDWADVQSYYETHPRNECLEYFGISLWTWRLARKANLLPKRQKRAQRSCENCGALHNNPKFCSITCAAIVNNKKYPKKNRSALRGTGTCRFCGSRCGTYSVFCSAECAWEDKRIQYIERWIAGKESGVQPKTGTITAYVRRYIRTLRGSEACWQCGWNEVHPITGLVPTTIDHVDGDYLNARPENLRLLCPNCHSLTPTYGNLNRGRGKPRYRFANAILTPGSS